MPDSVIYSPSDLGSFHMLYIDQGVAQLQYLWKHFHTAGLPNKLAVIALKWAQLLARVQQPILQQPSPPLHHLQLMMWPPSI